MSQSAVKQVMMMNQALKLNWKAGALSAALLTGAVGCQPTRVAPPPPPVVPSFTMPPTREAATAVLVPQVTKFADDISAFPGTTGADHRQTLVIALDDLTKILKLINGPDESAAFSTSLATIASAKNTADNQSIPRARMEAVENQALLATHAALKELSTRYLLDRDQLPALLDALSTKVTAASGVQGPMHDVDSTEAFQAVLAVVQQMTSDLKSMMPGAPATPPSLPETPVVPATPPSTPPVTPPASAPTTSPAPVPTPTPTP